ncbi:TPA: hypothetical protein N0F65_001997 [Lagenidium giganteum]|uniref:Elicitin n=1 Tax=Lagenidium giganteum TaxID=4803 RepID=A0AAV2Z1T4_9STRA|nr:TPA: hypothetical protein N0F65_001997 [Lagenidium giganteum]
MKTMTVAALMCVLALGVQAYDEKTPCSMEEYEKLTPLLTNANFVPCKEDSGYSVLPPVRFPEEEEYAAMAKSSACNKLMRDLNALKPSDCLLTFSNLQMINVKKLAEEYAEKSGEAAKKLR